MRLPPYPKYKPSGVEWLGEVPEHWTPARLRDTTNLINGFPFDSDFFSQSEGVPLVRIRDIYSQNTEALWSGPPIQEAEISDGDILIGMDGDFNVAWWAGGKALLNQRVCCLRSRTSVLSQRFLFYALPFPLKSLNDITYSTTVKHLSSLDVLRFRLYLPTPHEQRAIADFLDRETAKIDTLVAKKRTLIERLKEKRTALISRTVTRGLPPDAARAAGFDPHPKLKPSGIDWLGDVPEYWEVKRLKFILAAALKYGANESAELDDPTFPRYVRITDIDENDGLREETFRSLPADVAAEYLLREGDLLFARSGATAGKTFLYRQSWGECAFAGYLIRARIDRKKAVPEFVRYFTASSFYWQWLSSVFIQSTIQNVSAERYASLWIPLPPTIEQAVIATYLDRELATLDRMVAKVETAIERLQEYRSALITAAVTGKIDVRGAIA